MSTTLDRLSKLPGKQNHVFTMLLLASSAPNTSGIVGNYRLQFKHIQLLAPRTRFSPATCSYDSHSYASLILPLTWKFFHICCKHGRIQRYGLLQCGLAYATFFPAFRKYCNWIKTLVQWNFWRQSWSSLMWSSHQDLDCLHRWQWQCLCWLGSDIEVLIGLSFVRRSPF